MPRSAPRRASRPSRWWRWSARSCSRRRRWGGATSGSCRASARGWAGRRSCRGWGSPRGRERWAGGCCWGSARPPASAPGPPGRSAPRACRRAGRGLGAAQARRAFRSLPGAGRAGGALSRRTPRRVVFPGDRQAGPVTLRPIALRLRMIAILLGAAVLCGAPLAAALLLRERDEAVKEGLSSARAALVGIAEAVRASCGDDPAWANRGVSASGLEWSADGCRSKGGATDLCVDLPRGSVKGRIDAPGVVTRARARVGRTLALIALGMTALVAMLAVIFDRQLVRPLVRLDQAFDRLSAESDVPLPEAGDLLGRLMPSVRRLEDRLREERGRVHTQIAALSASNQELREARAEAARSERLASVGRLASGVAHELGNPVAAVLAYASLLKAKPDTQRAAEYAERLEREAVRMDRIL